MPNSEHIGHRIKAAMAEKNVGPKEVAKAFGVKPPSVNGCTKTGRVAKKHMTGLVAYFGKPLEWWLEGKAGPATQGAMPAQEPRSIYAVTPPPSIRSTVAALGDALDQCGAESRTAVAGLLAQYANNPKPGAIADAIVMFLERCALPGANNPFANAPAPDLAAKPKTTRT